MNEEKVGRYDTMRWWKSNKLNDEIMNEIRRDKGGRKKREESKNVSVL